MIDLMILFVLLNRDLTMYSVQKRIFEKFGCFSKPSFGALKPALVRLEKNKYITSSKVMSEGGKLSVFYAVTKDGISNLKNLLVKPLSDNPLQFMSDARVKLCCCSALDTPERKTMLEELKSSAYFHLLNTEKILSDEYTPVDFYQKIVLDNTLCEYKNLISMIEGFEKE